MSSALRSWSQFCIALLIGLGLVITTVAQLSEPHARVNFDAWPRVEQGSANLFVGDQSDALSLRFPETSSLGAPSLAPMLVVIPEIGIAVEIIELPEDKESSLEILSILGIDRGTAIAAVEDPAPKPGLDPSRKKAFPASRSTSPILKWIISEFQFQTISRTLEQRESARLVTAAPVTTRSGKPAQISIAQDSEAVSQWANAANAGETHLGNVIDINAKMGADSRTIEMTISPSLFEFIGYNLEPRVRQRWDYLAPSIGDEFAQHWRRFGIASDYPAPRQAAMSAPATQSVPERVFRIWSADISADLAPGQTVVIGGLPVGAGNLEKDKTALPGQLQWIGPLFSSPPQQKKSLLIFITPTLVERTPKLQP